MTEQAWQLVISADAEVIHPDPEPESEIERASEPTEESDLQ